MAPKTMLLSLCLLFALLHAASAAGARQQDVGVCYTTAVDDQPSAQEAVYFANWEGIRRIRLYGPDNNAFQALKDTNMEVMLGVPNEQLQSLASSQKNANQWIQDNIRNHQDVNFRYIVVGNGITPLYSQYSQLAQFVLPAMQNIRNALSASGLQNRIKVSTAIDQSEVLRQSFPPSKGEFRPEIRQFIDPIIRFLVNNKAPLLVNLHPYYSLVDFKEDIPTIINEGKGGRDARVDYALIRSSEVLVQDGQLSYSNAFDAMVDSLHSALEKVGGNSLDIVVSETGWPTDGGRQASKENAASYNNNLIKHVHYNGTPKRPQKRIETYIYSMFDETKKDQEIQKHWGIYWNNKYAKYGISFRVQ